MSDLHIFPASAPPPAAVAELARQVDSDGGAALCAFQEPIGHKWHLFALLPAALVKPTPFQRDLSPAHTKRMTEVMKKLGRYTEPIVAVRAESGEYWTPNGNHRRAAAVKLAPVLTAKSARARATWAAGSCQERAKALNSACSSSVKARKGCFWSRLMPSQ